MINVTATLDGRRVVGFADGDEAVKVATAGDIGQMLVGADGTYLFSGTADRSAVITLRLKPNSPTHRQLVQKWLAQRAGRLVGFPFDVIDAGGGEGGSGIDCFITKAPDDNKGVNATPREWVLASGDWTPRVPEA
jgi:hypothetical protein